MTMSGMVAYLTVTMAPTIGLVLGVWQAEFLAWFGRFMIGLPQRVFGYICRKATRKH